MKCEVNLYTLCADAWHSNVVYCMGSVQSIGPVKLAWEILRIEKQLRSHKCLQYLLFCFLNHSVEMSTTSDALIITMVMVTFYLCE